MTARIIIDFTIALMIATVAAVAFQKEDPGKVLPYFTVQSNLLCAAVSLVCAIWSLFAPEPLWLQIIKYAATCAVTVTFVTVFCYLGPRFKKWDYLLSGPNLWLHLFCPLLAIASLLLRTPLKWSFGIVFTGLAPEVLYALLYLKKVVLDPPEKRWDDLYGFTKGVSWFWSMIAMFTASFAISLLLWFLLGALK